MSGIAMLVVTADGEVRDHTVPAGDGELATSRAVLHALYEQIDCDTVDVVRLTPEIDMWLDDMGLVDNVPLNPIAIYIATRLGFHYQPFAGTAVFTGGADSDGNTRSLSSAARDVLRALIDEAPKG